MKHFILYSTLAALFVLSSMNSHGQNRRLTPHNAKLLPLVPKPKPADSTTLNYDNIKLMPSNLFMPLVFDKQQNCDTGDIMQHHHDITGDTKLNMNDDWLNRALEQRRRNKNTRYDVMVKHPQLVPYNVSTLPEPPKEHVVVADPNKNKLEIETAEVEPTAIDPMLDRREIKTRNWLHTVKTSLHFTQAYISHNWYQGGENNINVLGDLQWDINLNQKLHPNYLFENTLRYKIGVMTAHNDSLRNYAINEDNFQFNSKFGYKAIKNWYYSATLQFKTQLFNSYKSNTRTMTASFLSPGELNIGLGMTYNYKDENEIKVLSLSIAPLSYNLKECRDIERLKPSTFGIKDGRHTKHNFGSNLECKFVWKIRPNIAWSTRLYAFTNYEYVQGDWENTLDFSITRHLSTQIYTHLRYDKSRPYDTDWKHWQFKEILSFGLTYRFATN